jgi:hypothetical protein
LREDASNDVLHSISQTFLAGGIYKSIRSVAVRSQCARSPFAVRRSPFAVRSQSVRSPSQSVAVRSQCARSPFAVRRSPFAVRSQSVRSPSQSVAVRSQCARSPFAVRRIDEAASRHRLRWAFHPEHERRSKARESLCRWHVITFIFQFSFKHFIFYCLGGLSVSFRIFHA